MYQQAVALTDFFNSFGYPAYMESSVPQDVEMPYIAFSFSEPEWDQKASMFVRVWDRTRSNERIMQIADTIIGAIGRKKQLPIEGGYVVIWPDNPNAQIQVDGDFRYAYINLSINSYHMPGI